MAKRGQDSSGKLQELLDKMGSVTPSGMQGFWKPDEGRYTIRVLPPVGEMQFFFQEVGRHYNLPGGKSEYCSLFTTDGELECPICDLVRELYKSGSEKDKALAGNLRVRKSYWVNVIVRDKGDKKGETGSGPFIFTPGVKIFNYFQSLLANPEVGFFYDLDDGCDLYIDRTGKTKNDTEYQVSARRIDTPLHVDEEQEDKWLDAAKDLTPVVLSDDSEEDKERKGDAIVALLSYDRMLENYGVGPGIDLGDLDLGEEEEEVRASTQRRSKDESSSDDETEEAEEEDEVGASIRERRQRRRKR